MEDKEIEQVVSEQEKDEDSEKNQMPILIIDGKMVIL